MVLKRQNKIGQPSDLIIIAARPGYGKNSLYFRWQEILLRF